MTYKIAVYHLSVPKKFNEEKTNMLEFFATGAGLAGDQITNVRDHNIIDSDIAVIQGWIADKVSSPHLKLRNDTIAQQLSRKKYVVTADSNLFLYANKDNPLHYLRYSFNGIFPNTGIYCDTNIDPRRWQQIQQDLNISLQDYRTNGNHILICLQRNGGWSMGGQTVCNWTKDMLVKLRQHTARPIVLRAHPGDKQANTYLTPLMELADQYGFTISKNPRLQDDLAGCWAVVNHNSSPAVAAAIEGYPVFVTDPTRSQCRDIANTDLSKIEQPHLPERLQWAQRLAMSHWKFDELRTGQVWSHMRAFVRDIA